MNVEIVRIVSHLKVEFEDNTEIESICYFITNRFANVNDIPIGLKRALFQQGEKLLLQLVEKVKESET